MLRRHVVQLTTDASGNASGSTPAINGHIESIRYIKNNFDDTVDFDVYVGDANGTPVWQQDNVTASTTKFLRRQVQGPDGADVTGIYDRFPLASDQVLFVVAAGGNAKSGTFELVFDDGV